MVIVHGTIYWATQYCHKTSRDSRNNYNQPMKLHPFTNTCETFAHAHVAHDLVHIRSTRVQLPTHAQKFESWKRRIRKLANFTRTRSQQWRIHTAMIEFEITHAERIPDEQANHNRFDLYRIQISRVRGVVFFEFSFEKWIFFHFFFLSSEINLTRSLVTGRAGVDVRARERKSNFASGLEQIS